MVGSAPTDSGWLMACGHDPRRGILVRTLRFGVALFLRHIWVLTAPAAFLAVAVWLGVAYHSWSTVPLASLIMLHTAFGLLGSYVVHECGHFVGLGLCTHVSMVSVTSTPFRLSLNPAGQLTTRAALGVAVAGPLSAVLVGAGLWVLFPELGLGWWYLGHAAFLAPCFGDGRGGAQAAPPLATPA